MTLGETIRTMQTKRYKSRKNRGAKGGAAFSIAIHPHEEAIPELVGSCLINQAERSDPPSGALL